MKENVAASTQNQALAAALFLYEHVPEQPLERLEAVRPLDRFGKAVSSESGGIIRSGRSA